MTKKVNFHINEICNYSCPFCFAGNHSCRNKVFSTFEEKKQIIHELGKYKDEYSINFAGGEPLLEEGIIELIKYAYEEGLNPSLITNGFFLKENNLLSKILPYISMLGISFHTFSPSTKKKLGFCNSFGDSLSFEDLKSICSTIQAANLKGIADCKIKINTVITSLNYNQSLKENIELLKIDRWKCLRCQEYDNNSPYMITDEQYETFKKLNTTNLIKQVFEDDMSTSYIMINPKGQLKQKNKSDYTYSQSLLEIPFPTLMKEYEFNKKEYEKNHR